MNITAINNLPTPQPQQNFRGKAPQRFLEVITEKRPLSNYTTEHILPKFKEVIKAAKFYGKPVRVAQLEGEKLLVNVGNISKVVDANTTPLTEIPNVLSGIIKANNIAEERGLKAGLSYLA